MKGARDDVTGRVVWLAQKAYCRLFTWLMWCVYFVDSTPVYLPRRRTQGGRQKGPGNAQTPVSLSHAGQIVTQKKSQFGRMHIPEEVKDVAE